jgi:NAD(P)-dependent dehydrogenase (short-subunit alcohol dehydrogenase family)
MKALLNKVAIVTGAASGIGLAVCTRFLEEGAHVVALDRDIAGLEALQRAQPDIKVISCDVTDHPELRGAVEKTLGEHGRIDILVNNAGFSYYKLHVDSSLEEWRRTHAVNAEAMYALAKLVTPSMIAARYGRIVNISSIQAQAAGREVTAYAASKGAVAAWTRALAVELAEHDIIVNAVAPGAIYTPMSMINGVDTMLDPDYIEWYERRRKIPLGRSGRPEEVASAVVFLSGEQCTYVTGHTLVVDGGLTITF